MTLTKINPITSAPQEITGGQKALKDFQACADSREHERRSRVFETEYSVTAVETEALSVSAA